MGILSRFKDIMSANINALLDKAEDPEKMIDQYLRNIESDLGKVKAETAAVMAEETRCKRQLDECTEEVNKYQRYDPQQEMIQMQNSSLLRKHSLHSSRQLYSRHMKLQKQMQQR